MLWVIAVKESHLDCAYIAKYVNIVAYTLKRNWQVLFCIYEYTNRASSRKMW
jgi:hypothetical protein